MSKYLKTLRSFRVSILLLVYGAVFYPFIVFSQVELTVQKGTREPIIIAISDFAVSNTSALQVSQNIAQVIRNNLYRSGLFNIVDPGTYPETPNEIAAGPTLEAWRITSARALSGGRTTFQDDGRLRIEFQLWDVAQGRELEGLAFSTQPNNWRRIAHLASDKIYEQLTGTPGMFDSRIVYVAESGSATNRIKQLAIMDHDGGNPQILTPPDTLVLTPRFSPNSQEITYLSYAGDYPRVMLYNLNTRQQAILGDFPGMSFAPRFSPDGNQVVFSLAVDGNTDIYLMDLRTGQQRQLTSNPTIDTSPSFSPDGRQIVFETDRDGKQQLYVMDISGANQRRISFDDGSYGTPVWSPTGDWIAFTRRHQGQFSVGIMEPNGSNKKILANAYIIEGPTWSPNGTMLSYFKQEQTGQTRLHTMDIYTFREWMIPTQTDASDPAWSPLLGAAQR